MLWYIATALANAALWTELGERWELSLFQKICGVALTALLVSAVLTNYGIKI